MIYIVIAYVFSFAVSVFILFCVIKAAAKAAIYETREPVKEDNHCDADELKAMGYFTGDQYTEKSAELKKIYNVDQES